MRVAVIGGKLQGVEAVYLAKEAGWEVVLIDKEKQVPAFGLSDSFCLLDVTCEDQLRKAMKGIDLVIPALENSEALSCIDKCTKELGIPFLYDAIAYSVSSSKTISNEFFDRVGVPTPNQWPLCGFPVIAKPSDASGSDGVVKISNLHELNLYKAMARLQDDWVIEEYLEGPSYSIEVIGFAGQYKALQITELQMDKIYDCKRVLTAEISPELQKQFEDIALTIADNLNLNGVMDVEVIMHQGILKVLEIDARLPSQTPTAVYKSTGINMLQLLGEAFVNQKVWNDFEVKENRSVVYEHLQVLPYQMEVCGEHIMAETKFLYLYREFFGADEVLTDYEPGKLQWSATLIITGKDRKEAWKKRCDIIERIKKELVIANYVDLSPTPMEETIYHLGNI